MSTLTLSEKLDQLGNRYEEMTQQLSTPEAVSDSARFQKLAKQHSELAEIVNKHREFKQIEKDLASPEVKSTLEESFKLAEALGLNGTPSYVIGSDVVVGAVGLPALQEKINTSRCGKPTC